VYDDFNLYSQVNFSVSAPQSPPEVVIEVHVTILDLGEFPPNRVDVYGPSGFKFLLSCFAPGQEDILEEYFVSCRERWSIWNGNYLSGAVMMTVNGGIPKSILPVTVKLLVQTPAQTPLTNSWYVRALERDGVLGWGMQRYGFPIRPMDVDIAYAASASTRAPLFLALRVRVPLPYGGHIHLAAPRLYQLYCPVTKVLHGPFKPDCTQDDPILTGCYGLPSPGDPNPPWGLPLCDPLHEVLLTFPKQEGFQEESEAADPNNLLVQPEDIYAMLVGDSIFLSLDVQVPEETPSPRIENVFRVRLMDESKLTLDGKLNEFGGEVRDMPRVEGFKLWWTRAMPDAIITVAVEFTFNTTIPRELEDPEQRLQVIQIMAPEGLKMAVRRPKDVMHLAPSSNLAVTVWNWTGTMPRGLWFGLDEKKNVTGRFHYAFPVLLPGQEELPYNNLWRVHICADSPFCTVELLSVPMPGFFFGEEPTEQLSQEAFDALMGSHAMCQAHPALLAILPSLLSLPLMFPLSGHMPR